MNMPDFLEVAKSSLEKTIEKIIPLRNQLEKLEGQKAYFEGVLQEGLAIFPDAKKNIKLESILQQYNRKVVIHELKPSKQGTVQVTRKSTGLLENEITALFKKNGGQPLHIGVIAEALVKKGFYDDERKAFFRVENYFNKHKDSYVKAAPRQFRPRVEISTIGEAVEGKAVKPRGGTRRSQTAGEARPSKPIGIVEAIRSMTTQAAATDNS
jgi:hypothetical protein